MKTLMLLLAALGLTIAAVGGSPFDPQFDAFRQRAEGYAEIALLQMQTDRRELNELARQAGGAADRLTPVYALVKRGEELILRMRSAPPTEFEAIKADFERNRIEIDRALGRNRWTG